LHPSALFGHIQGAFTGAKHQKRGLLEEAEKGSLFMDEVGNIPLTIQTKLLRVLQNKEFKPLGSNENKKVDIRIIAATNADLQCLVREGNFREDFYYRLAVIPLLIPPLRERKEDIPLLASYFVRKHARENNKNIQKSYFKIHKQKQK
jgi:transcriptional regulator with GAF, ATPase, and Fis domain